MHNNMILSLKINPAFITVGNVKFVAVDIAKHPYRTQDKKTVFPAIKKFLQAYIPQGIMTA